MKKVLLLKAPKYPEDLYEKELKLAGYEPHFIKVLHFQFLNSDRLSSALHCATSYSGIVFTSQTTVEACQAALTPLGCSHQDGKGSSNRPDVPWKQHLEEQWSSLPVFVVGKATAEAACRLGLTSSIGAMSGNADELSKVIIQYFESRGSSSVPPLLFPCSSIRRDTLPSNLLAAGLAVEEVPCYDTVPHPHIAENVRGFADLVAGGEEVGVVFFSPSGVSFVLHEILQISRARQVTMQFVAIGMTSAEALSGAGHTPSKVALSPSPSGLIAAISQST